MFGFRLGMALTLAVAVVVVVVVVRIGGGAAKAKRSRNECVFFCGKGVRVFWYWDGQVVGFMCQWLCFPHRCVEDCVNISLTIKPKLTRKPISFRDPTRDLTNFNFGRT